MEGQGGKAPDAKSITTRAQELYDSMSYNQRQLYLSENTVRTYLAHVLEKLGLENRVQAAAYALRNGIA